MLSQKLFVTDAWHQMWCVLEGLGKHITRVERKGPSTLQHVKMNILIMTTFLLFETMLLHFGWLIHFCDSASVHEKGKMLQQAANLLFWFVFSQKFSNVILNFISCLTVLDCFFLLHLLCDSASVHEKGKMLQSAVRSSETPKQDHLGLIFPTSDLRWVRHSLRIKPLRCCYGPATNAANLR